MADSIIILIYVGGMEWTKETAGPIDPTILDGSIPAKMERNPVCSVCVSYQSVGRFRMHINDTKHTYRTPKAQQQKQEKQTTSTNHNYVRTLAVFKSRWARSESKPKGSV